MDTTVEYLVTAGEGTDADALNRPRAL